MKIKDRPEFNRKNAVLTFGPDETVFNAIKAMSEKNYGASVIVDPEDRPIGIVTERDFMRRLIAGGLDPQTTRLREIMTTDMKLARADDDLLDWMRQMSNDRFRRLPIVDEQGKLVGIMSQGDFVSYTWPQLGARVTQQARATFDVNPSMFVALAGISVFLLAAVIMIWVIAEMA
jgi:CBS domain-containing protein